MANMFEYINWRGDLNLKEFKFNEVDNLILSRFSYFPFENIIEDEEEVSIEKLSKRFKKEDTEELVILWDDDVDFFVQMGKTKRFGELKATNYINKISVEEEQQFSAITIILPDGTLYISYRGTDNTIVAWKENFNMFVKNNLPSQLDAVSYLEKIANKYPDKKIRLGGHSKGGNLAMYAAAFIKDENIRNRIINIYNNDGPGFRKGIIKTKEYKTIIKKVSTYIPPESIFGKLLNHEEEFFVVNSSQKGFLQHDPYTWQVTKYGFETVKDVTDWSRFVDKSIKGWFNEIDVKQREQVIDVMFDILYSTEVDTFEEIGKDWFEKAKVILKSYKSLDKKTRKMIMGTLMALVKSAKNNWVEDQKENNKIIRKMLQKV